MLFPSGLRVILTCYELEQRYYKKQEQNSQDPHIRYTSATLIYGLHALAAPLNDANKSKQNKIILISLFVLLYFG